MTNNPKIVIKAELDHVRQYPGMYIGNTFTPNNLIREIIDNSLDEIINDFASTITINTNDDGHAIITDNGRGIPIHNIEYNGKMHDSIVIACTKLMAGAKFDNNSYSRSVGMHGIGLKAANALSSWMRVSVKDKNDLTKIHDYQFENSDLVSKEIINYDIDWSTRIEVQVNPKFFDSVKFIDSEIIQRLRLIKAHHKNKKIIFNDEEIEEVDVEDFIKENLLLDEELPLFKLSTEKNNSNITCYFTYDLENSPTPSLKGDVNYLLCNGTFQSTFLTLVGNTVSEMSQGSVSKADAVKYIKAYLSIQIPDPSFDSQSKHNMTKNLYDLMSLMKNDIKLLYSTQTFLKEAIVSIIEAKTLKTISKKIPKKKKRISITNPLKDAQQIPGKRLYIVEGESASGPIAAKRNSKIEGCLPLSGKILNVTKKTTEEVVDSKKFRNILEAIGIEVGKKQQQYRYEYIDVLTDADSISAEEKIVYLNNDGNIECRMIKDIDNIQYVTSLNKKTGKIEKKKVLQIIQHEYNSDEIFEITTLGNYKLQCTDDHVIYVYDNRLEKIIETKPTDIDINNHYLIVPTKYPTPNKSVSFQISQKKIKITPELAYFIGRYISSKIDFENSQLDKKTKQNLQAIICEYDLANTKLIPKEFFSCKENVRLNLIVGLFEDDDFIHITTSKQLHEGIILLLRQFGIIPLQSTEIIDNQLNYILNVTETEYFKQLEDWSIIELSDDLTFIQIKAVEKIPYNYDMVYDLEVEDNNNFNAGLLGSIIHNSDGLHITCLVIIGLWKYAPSLILNKRVGIILPPLYGTTINKKFIPIYTTDELKNYPNQHITRFKGLGEMNSNQMEVILQNPLRYIVEAPKNKEEELSIIETMRNTELKRRLCEHPETFNFNRLFQKTKEMKEN